MCTLLSLASGLAAFTITLPILTLFSAWVADVTGQFRPLFISKPGSLIFRVLRWCTALMLAVVTALLVGTALE
jgi:hypothetical protein